MNLFNFTVVVDNHTELFALKKSIYLNKVIKTMLTDKIIKKIKNDNFWYKQIVQASIHTDNFEIFSQIYSPKKLVNLNLSNIGIKILHLIAPSLYNDQFIDLMKKFISNKSLNKIKILMLHWDVETFSFPDILWSKLLETLNTEIFEYLMCKVNYEYPKYLFDRLTDIFVSKWIDIVPEKYICEVSSFVSKSICENKMSYLKIVLPKCKQGLNISIQPNDLVLQKVKIDTFCYVIRNNLINLTDLSVFDRMINRIILSESSGILKPLLSNKKILDHIRMIKKVDFVRMNFLPLEMPSVVSSIAAIPIQHKKMKIFDLFLSKGVYSQYRSFWLEFALVIDSQKIFDSILATCSEYDIMKSNYRLIYIASSNPKYLVKILEKFSKLDNFNPEYYDSLFYRELYSNINRLNHKIKSAIPSTYNPLYICNVLLSSSTTSNEFKRILNEHKSLIESNLDIILNELIQLNFDLNIRYLIESFEDASLYEDGYLHLLNYLSSNLRTNLVFIDLCNFFSSQIDLREDNDHLFSQLFPRCKNRMIYDYFVNKYPEVYSYFVDRKSEVIGIKIGSKIIGQETDGFIALKPIQLESKELCSICCETESDIITKCSHQYCLSCITRWYTQNKETCPVCRQEYYPVNRI
jgi:hypothetical protein